MLDKHTFGNTPCAENLATILNEINDEKISKKVSAFFQDKNQIVKALLAMNNHAARAHLSRLFAQSLDAQELAIPEKFYTHAVNVVVARLRDGLKE